jgi:Domain of Unknown Function (DUF1206)
MGEAKQAAREAEDSKPVELLGRLGLLCRGVIWLVMGLLAAQVASGGDEGTRADRTGALRAIEQKPFGTALLVVLAVGFTGYAVWRLLEGLVGHRDVEAGRKRWGKKAVSFFRVALYTGFAVSTVRFLISGSSNDKTKPLTARVMSATGGRTLVFLVGAAVVIGGLTIAVRAFRQKFADKLDTGRMPGWLESATRLLGTTGLVSRGAVFTLIGVFLIDAARTFEPDKAKGFDATLKTVAREAYGRGLLFAAACGLVAFAVWSFLEARYRKI